MNSQVMLTYSGTVMTNQRGLESELESPGQESKSESIIWRRLQLRTLSVYLDFCVILL